MVIDRWREVKNERVGREIEKERESLGGQTERNISVGNRQGLY